MMPDRPVAHIVDDDETLRESLAFVLSSVGIETRTHASAPDFLAALPDRSSGCVITDVRMPGMSGIDLLRELREQEAGCDVIVMTGHADVPLAVEAMRLGAVDFIEKPFKYKDFVAVVQGVLERQQKVTQEKSWRADTLRRLGALSDRERQVLDGLIEGKANKQIAYDLGISPRTVEVHRANLMTKMQAKSLSELVRMALSDRRQPAGAG
jgi:two-component system response regulator FixJ